MDPKRKQRNAEIMMDDFSVVTECFLNPGHSPNWDEVRRFVSAPVHGEGQLGTILAEIESSVKRNDEKAFYEAVLVGVRMLRRQANPMGQQEFGKGG